jgi:hypothetical protein
LNEAILIVGRRGVMIYVYVLISEKDSDLYMGQTKNLSVNNAPQINSSGALSQILCSMG